MIESYLGRLDQQLRRHFTMVVADPMDPETYRQHPMGIPKRDPVWQPALRALAEAGSYIFDSGYYPDDLEQAARETDVPQIRATSNDMLACGRFHLPERVCLIEDYFASNPETRNVILAEEHQDCIDLTTFLAGTDSRGQTRFMFFPYKIIIPLLGHAGFAESMAQDGGLMARLHDWIAPELDPLLAQHFNAMRGLTGVSRHVGTMGFTVKKFIAVLGSKGVAVEPHPAVRVPRHPVYGRPLSRPYKVVRVPFLHEVDSEGNRTRHEPGDGPRRRAHFVRGHLRFRDRPIAEQIWIRPHWRGEGQPVVPVATVVQAR